MSTIFDTTCRYAPTEGYPNGSVKAKRYDSTDEFIEAYPQLKFFADENDLFNMTLNGDEFIFEVTKNDSDSDEPNESLFEEQYENNDFAQDDGYYDSDPGDDY